MPLTKPNVDFNAMDEPSDYLPALNALANAVDHMVDAANLNEQAALDAQAVKRQVEELKAETSGIRNATQNILYLTEQIKNATQRVSLEAFNFKPVEDGYDIVNGDRVSVTTEFATLSLADFIQFKEAGHWFVIANDSDGVIYLPAPLEAPLKASRSLIESPNRFVITSGHAYLFRLTASGEIKISVA